LRLVLEEGLENCFARHKINSNALVAGLESMGLKMVVSKEHRLPDLNAVYIPAGINDLDVKRILLDNYNYGIEIGGDLGEFKGKVWRIGLMDYTSKKENVIFLLSTLEEILASLGYKANKRGIFAAAEVYRNERECKI